MSESLRELEQVLNASRLNDAAVNGSRTIQPTFIQDINIGLYWIGIASIAVAIVAWMVACCSSKRYSDGTQTTCSGSQPLTSNPTITLTITRTSP